MSYKIAIIGGSFDPIHQGHIAMGKTVIKQLQVDKVLYVPTLQNPLKKPTQTAYVHRCEMVKLALENKMELLENDSIYTIDLVKFLYQKYPNTQFYFVMGADSLQTLSKWKDIEHLKTLVQFVVFTRNRQQITTEFDIICLSLNETASSTLVRQGEFKYLPFKVKEYIFKHCLYLKDIVKQQVSEKRFNHILSVQQTANQLCVIHQKSAEFKKEMWIASLFHDVAKDWNQQRLYDFLTFKNRDTLKKPSYAWHAYAGAYYVKDVLCYENSQVFSAIYNHTLLEEETDFNLILKLADYLEPTRNYDTTIIFKLASQNLKQAYLKMNEVFNNK